MSAIPFFDAVRDDSDENYFDFVHTLTALAVKELIDSGHDPEKQKQAIKRYFSRGMTANLTVMELWDFLGISSDCVLDKSGLFQTEEEIEFSAQLADQACMEAIAEHENNRNSS